MLAFPYYQWVAGVGVPLTLAILGLLFKRFDKNNSNQHAENQMVLQEIRSEVGDIRKSQLEHLEWHLANPTPHTPTLKVVTK